MTSTHTHMHMPTTVSPCRCGCSDCQGDCCSLECLNRPNFFCGQVLTDEDLKALVDWVEGKGALKRFRDGWGVACGLEVECSHEFKKSSRAVVSPGYAVDCCGRDIVVCEPIWYDFTCEKPFDSCCPEPKPIAGQTPPLPASAEMLGRIPVSELRAFELCLRVDEKLSGGQRPLVRGNCRPLDECQYTRVKETGKLYAKEVVDPCVMEINRTESKYRSDIKLFLADLINHIRSAADLRDWIHGKLHSFCFIEEWICETIDVGKKQQPGVTIEVDPEWLFYIVQDWRNHYFQCLCDPCKGDICEGDGVPLARVWLWHKDRDDCKICKVVYVDSYPPYRRFLGRECWPIQRGCVDVSRYIWRDADEVRPELGRAGITKVTPKPIPKVTQAVWDDYLTGLQREAPDGELICVPHSTEIQMLVYPDLCGRNRVIGFSL